MISLKRLIWGRPKHRKGPKKTEKEMTEKDRVGIEQAAGKQVGR